ncbi:MAG: helix-turn-helix domain-containing protein [bacterium]
MEPMAPGWTFGSAAPAWGRDLWRRILELAAALDYVPFSADIEFVAFLRTFSQFGFFRFGPITIDVNVVEDILMRTHPRGAGGPEHPPGSLEAIELGELQWAIAAERGSLHIDELSCLFGYLRWGKGLPARVFGELGVTEDELEGYVTELSAGGRREPSHPPVVQKLYSTEDAAGYLGVHIQTVRAWIRSGKLPASRLAGQKSIRIRERDLEAVLEPIDPREFDGDRPEGSGG